MRDIAADFRLLAGSMYRHFASKDEMLFEACKVGVERVIGAHNAPIEDMIEPWARLENRVPRLHPRHLMEESQLAEGFERQGKRNAIHLGVRLRMLKLARIVQRGQPESAHQPQRLST